jgi:hypothetical protein
MPPHRKQSPASGPMDKRKGVGMKKAASAASASARSKANLVPKPKPKPQKARTGAPKMTDHSQWSVIPADEGSMLRLASEPCTTIRLSAGQVEARQAARAAAQKDPEAYLGEVRSATQ